MQVWQRKKIATNGVLQKSLDRKWLYKSHGKQLCMGSGAPFKLK